MKAGHDKDGNHRNWAKANIPLQGRTTDLFFFFVIPVLQDRSKWRQTGRTMERGREEDGEGPTTCSPGLITEAEERLTAAV